MSRAQEITYLPGLTEQVEAEKKRRDCTYREIAADMGLNEGHLNNLCSQKKGASLAVALRCARYFKVPIERLTGDLVPK